MIISINETDCKADTLVYMKISKPTKALVDVKPESYQFQILIIGPLHEMLRENSSSDHSKARKTSTLDCYCIPPKHVSI